MQPRYNKWLLIATAVLTSIAALLSIVAIATTRWRHVYREKNGLVLADFDQGLFKTCGTGELESEGCKKIEKSPGGWFDAVRTLMFIECVLFVGTTVFICLEIFKKVLPKLVMVAVFGANLIAGLSALIAGGVYAANVAFDENDPYDTSSSNSQGTGGSFYFSSSYSADTLSSVQLAYVAGIIGIVTFVTGLIYMRNRITDNTQQLVNEA